MVSKVSKSNLDFKTLHSPVFLDSYDAGLVFLHGGALEYSKIGAEADPVGYNRCTTVMVQLSHVSDVSYDS